MIGISTNYQNFISASNCKYTFKGQNLVEMRRAKLRLIAGAFGLDTEAIKNDLLGLIIVKLNAMGAENEITDLVQKPKKPAKKKAKKK